MNASELWQLDATQQVALVAAGQVSCVELIEAHLARIEAINPRLNAIVTVLDRAARARAGVADDASVRGPLHGLPFTVKSEERH
jgi:Asp-tRNA(Asn)/Glu-tRNA(Gln) amidotransferase A subunit family amidase